VGLLSATLTFLDPFIDFSKDLTLILWSAMWTWGIFTIAFYGSSVGWGIMTWLPLSGYTVGTFALAWYLNKARKATQNSDDKKWPTDEERTAMIEKMREVKERS
jgi:hypothetical protein